MRNSIEKNHDRGGFSIYKWSVYPKHSVLAGQQCKQYIGHSETLIEAKLEYPDADVGYQDAGNTYDHLDDREGSF